MNVNDIDIKLPACGLSNDSFKDIVVKFKQDNPRHAIKNARRMLGTLQTMAEHGLIGIELDGTPL